MLSLKVSKSALRSVIAGSKCIIRIDVDHGLIKFIVQLFANRRESVIKQRTVVWLPSEIDLWGQDTVPEAHIKHLIDIIELVFCASISYHESLKFWDKSATLVLSAISNVPINSLNKTRNVDSSIGFTRDIDISILKFWELVHNSKEGL